MYLDMELYIGPFILIQHFKYFTLLTCMVSDKKSAIILNLAPLEVRFFQPSGFVQNFLFMFGFVPFVCDMPWDGFLVFSEMPGSVI